jgi:hypothetical protein
MPDPARWSEAGFRGDAVFVTRSKSEDKMLIAPICAEDNQKSIFQNPDGRT